MGKVLEFKPRRTKIKPAPSLSPRSCPHCRHGLSIHVVHRDGLLECVMHKCFCRLRP
jgi:hypothetical protein